MDKSQTIGGWAVSLSVVNGSAGPTSAKKTFETADFIGSFEFLGGEQAIAKLLSGAYEIGFQSGRGETVMLASKDSAASCEPDSHDPTIMNFRIEIHPKTTARSTNLGGTMSAGNSWWIQNDWVWWGASAWSQPSSGNVDLELWKNSWGSWSRVAFSGNPDTLMDQVSYNHGPGWSAYKLVVLAVADSTYTGQVSW